MLSESARMTSAHEARFRIQAPNSSPRAVTILALDALAERVVARLAGHEWPNATFLVASSSDTATDLDGRPRPLQHSIDAADLVVMVAGPGGRAHAARAIGSACSERRVMTTALIIGSKTAPDDALSRTLAQLRPWSLMVVIADDDGYIDDMLVALRA